MEPTLVVVGLNYQKAPVDVRERFWISEPGRYECLHELAHSDGIEEIVVLATCSRTEFILWASDFSAAANAILRFLTRHHGLRLCEWRDFYRLLGDEALLHVFRVTAGLDSILLGEPQIVEQVRSAWTKARQAGMTGSFLDTLFEKALAAAENARTHSGMGAAAVSVPYAAIELARQSAGSLEGLKAVILGAGKMGELSARYLMNAGACAVLVAPRTYQHALDIAQKLHSLAVPFDQRWQHLENADLVIACTGCPHIILTCEDAARIRAKNEGHNLLLIDLAVPRNIDPRVRELPGVLLHDIDDLQLVAARGGPERETAALAENMVAGEARRFRHSLSADRDADPLAVLRCRLDDVRHREIEHFRRDSGPLTAVQEKALDELTSRLVRHVTGLVVAQLRDTT